MRIADHLGMQLSPPLLSLAPGPCHMGVDTANLELEESDASNLQDGEDLESEGGPQNMDEPADADDASSDDPNAVESKSFFSSILFFTIVL